MRDQATIARDSGTASANGGWLRRFVRRPAWQWFNRSAIIVWILLLSKMAWMHEWQLSVFCGICIIGNAWCHWKTPNDES